MTRAVMILGLESAPEYDPDMCLTFLRAIPAPALSKWVHWTPLQ